MCLGGSAPKDNSGEIAAQQEAKRQANITAGVDAVNKAFGSGFDQPFYDNITKSYENYYDPQLDLQYQNALNSLTDQLGQQGILQSSEGNRQIGLLKQTYDTNRQTVANNALNAAQTARQSVAQQKNQLLAQAQQAGDPNALAAQAAEAASSVATNPNYSPLGNVFAGLLGQGTNALAIQQGANYGGGFGFNQGFSQPLPGNSGGGSSTSGSGRVVG